MIGECEDCQVSLHTWGRANVVRFDAGKECFHIIHRTCDYGEDVALLGVLFDCQLRMGSTVARLAREAGWRLTAILRARRFFQVRGCGSLQVLRAVVLGIWISGVFSRS